MSFLCLFFVIFLSGLGFINLIETFLKKLFLKNKKVPIKEVKIPIYGHCENIEFIIRKIIFKYSWLKEYQNLKITIIDHGADNETLKICNALKRKIQNLEIS